jgi:hypothetical protein
MEKAVEQVCDSSVSFLLPYGTDTLSMKKALTNNAFTLLNGDGYEHRKTQLFLRYFVIVKTIILSTNGFELYKNPTAA